MNCCPNDLAIVVSAPGPATASMVGKIVRVTRAVFDGEWCWEYTGPRVLQSVFGAVDLVEDEFLRPIAPGGVTDEEVRELYAPTLPAALEA